MDAPTDNTAFDDLPERLGAMIKAHPLYQRIAELGPPDPDPPPDCLRCSDLGFVRHDVAPDHPSFGKILPCVCRQQGILQRRLARFWESSQAPAEYRDCTLESYPGDPSAVPAIREWLDSTRWLILHGEYGSGKTGLTVAIGRVFGECGSGFLFVNAPAMLRRVRATYGDKDTPADSESAVVDSLANVEILAIDDIGKERLTDWGRELLYDIVNRRYNAGKRTLVTTNLATDTLEVHLGSATFWRLFQRSQMIRVEGNLRRRKGA